MNTLFRKKALIVLAGLLFPTSASAAVLSGKVARTTGSPAGYIRVALTCAGHEPIRVYTGSDGSYYFAVAPIGKCRLAIGNADKPTSFLIDVREPATNVPLVKIP